MISDCFQESYSLWQLYSRVHTPKFPLKARQYRMVPTAQRPSFLGNLLAILKVLVPMSSVIQRYTPWWTTQLSLSHPVSTFHALILLIKATFNCIFAVLVWPLRARDRVQREKSWVNPRWMYSETKEQISFCVFSHKHLIIRQK